MKDGMCGDTNKIPEGIELLPNGQWIVAGDTHISEWAKAHGSIITDPYLHKWLEPLILNSNTVWDIGANIGDHTRKYLDLGKRVVAVEPNPIAFLCLSHNCPEAILLNVAASSSNGELRFSSLKNLGASRVDPSGEIVVPSVAMDAVEGIPKPDFIKIDVEGWEVEALRGMEKTINHNHPDIYIEINSGALAYHGQTCDTLLEMFREFGYDGLTIHPEQCSWNDPQFDVFCCRKNK